MTQVVIDWEHRRWEPVEPRATRCSLILGRLQMGPATALDLMKAGGGMRVGARLKNLRDRGHRILGPLPWKRPDGNVERETTTPMHGYDVYRLVV